MFRVIGILLLAGWLPSAFALTVNFDDIDASLGDVSIDALSPYQGFTWTNFTAYTDTPGFQGFNNGIVSDPNAAYSGGELFDPGVTPVTGHIQAASPFDFASAMLGSGYYDGLALTVEGRLSGTRLFFSTVTVVTTGAQLFNFGFTGIDELVFYASITAGTTDPFLCGTSNCTQFTLDGLVFAPASEPPPPPPPGTVPEPPVLALFGLALLAAGLARKRGTIRLMS